jgi:hypothetical protein
VEGVGERVIGTGGSGEVAGRGGRRMNTVQIMYTHVCKCKNDTCQNCSRNGGEVEVEVVPQIYI